MMCSGPFPLFSTVGFPFGVNFFPTPDPTFLVVPLLPSIATTGSFPPFFILNSLGLSRFPTLGDLFSPPLRFFLFFRLLVPPCPLGRHRTWAFFLRHTFPPKFLAVMGLPRYLHCALLLVSFFFFLVALLADPPSELVLGNFFFWFTFSRTNHVPSASGLFFYSDLRCPLSPPLAGSLMDSFLR